ncbi:PilZ domain-containing protein [bacterium]|nr:PilZ domain-containing protein [bacterium]
MTEIMDKERRFYNRVNVDYDIKCKRLCFDDKQPPKEKFKVNDISAGGLSFLCEQEFVIGDLLKIELFIKGWEKFYPEFFKYFSESLSGPIVVLGSVKRIHLISDGSYKIAVCFSSIDPGHRLALKRIVDKESRNQEL